MNFKTAVLCTGLGLGLFAGQVSVQAGEEGTPTIKHSLLLQSWLFNDSTNVSPAGKPNFRLRRAELKASVDFGQGARAFVMIDPAKNLTVPVATTNDNKIIQDLGIGIMLAPGIEFVMGQFKTQTTAEGLISSANLVLPERSIVGRTNGDQRQPGAMIARKGEGYTANVMFSNGQGTNVDDVDGSKDLSARVDSEVMPGLKVGAHQLAKNFRYSNLGQWGLNAEYTKDEFRGFVEGIYNTNKAGVKTNGVTGEFSYQATPVLQPVARVETLKTNSAASRGTAITLGLNYWAQKNVKVQLAGARLTNLSGANGSPSYQNGSKGAVLWLALSASL